MKVVFVKPDEVVEVRDNDNMEITTKAYLIIYYYIVISHLLYINQHHQLLFCLKENQEIY